MKKRRLGQSELELPVITFGAWAIGGLFWGGSDDREAAEAIRAAIDKGIDAIDTAPMYGCGHSEELVGQAVAGVRERVKLLTKCGLRWDDTSGEFHFRLDETPYGRPVTVYKNVSAQSIFLECEASLKRLQTDYIDLYQVHWPSASSPAEETIGALVKLQEQGKILHFGVSNYNATQLDEARRHGIVASNQIRYNLLERDIENEVLPYCVKNQVGVIAYSPMAMGLLTGKVSQDRKFPATDVRSSMPLFSKSGRRNVLKSIDQVQPIAARYGRSPAQLAVAWVLAQPGVTTALVGARNAQQIGETCKAADLELTPEEVSTIARAFAR